MQDSYLNSHRVYSYSFSVKSWFDYKCLKLCMPEASERFYGSLTLVC